MILFTKVFNKYVYLLRNHLFNFRDQYAQSLSAKKVLPSLDPKMKRGIMQN